MDGQKVNQDIMRVFSKMYSGQKAGSLSNLEEKDWFKSQSLDFLMGHKSGCLICRHFINEYSKNHKLFPHLFYPNRDWSTKSIKPVKGSKMCPNILRLSLERRTEIIDKLPFCKAYLRCMYNEICHSCTNPQNVKRGCKGYLLFMQV